MQAQAQALVEYGRAKVNLTLRVVGRRVDGYHDLESVVAFADCADRLELLPGPELKLETTGPLADACGATSDNLVLKAARLLAERVENLALGAFMLEKVLPVAAGIGGGSADAAAALRLLARLNGLAVDDARLQEVALKSGADVPVCLASRACDMTGVGETLLPLSLPKLPALLVNPRMPVATKDVFAALGLRSGQLRVGASDVIRAPAWPDDGASVGDWVQVLASVPNDLEPPALRVQPVIADVLSALRASPGALLARMSGSGATCFAIFSSASEAQAAAAKLSAEHPDWWVHAGELS
ncbi:4-(cytidine 5'-diphospho)-2-C-methyl-D-erythritol kinase [Bradyrhizobium sp.]|uniref:4-(cytidine 5'-diphospho)-2-C-methyl-D-erythritol kinase n=1 Tax=Bradyrhizobium sp. TaxID=376 RepID=UPI001D2609AC|nr:4-(cytidine 5'-diphospho)-2-C-methyl-D-erythritol kinase [Bradyrhizobium sp.]MBV8701977.1 4-(cytidine 5'-diphospho)-2-C-methyl-D-erythritol kinase [Bradyrhizobium sp.]MBV8917741.1 4-(cytidine 5'-diphospho)-2-C-methyl-D-erythritol kinase [Bradyrhizobium sp.]MBV9978718.1 4-(cytidine 5'-diphospho)-2-C-methyl-D-erythritol kinase [Bradyrhizobium sp.]